jgi:hypothetical protein
MFITVKVDGTAARETCGICIRFILKRRRERGFLYFSSPCALADNQSFKSCTCQIFFSQNPSLKDRDFLAKQGQICTALSAHAVGVACQRACAVVSSTPAADSVPRLFRLLASSLLTRGIRHFQSVQGLSHLCRLKIFQNSILFCPAD